MSDATDNDPGLSLEDLSPEDRRALPHDHPLLDAYADKVNNLYKLAPGLLNALKNAGEASESSGKLSVSPKGAVGVMQFLPTTAKTMGVGDPRDPLEAIDGAGRYARKIADDLQTDDPTLIAAGYNAGHNRASLRKGEVPRIPETQAYVRRVNNYMNTVPGGTAVISPADVNPEDRGQLKMLPSGISPEDLQPRDRNQLKKDMGLDPTQDMSTGQRMLAASGKFFSDTGRGLGQLAADWAVNPTSRFLTKSEANPQGRDLIPDMKGDEAESRALDGPLMDTTAGKVGYAGTAALATLLPAGWVSKAAPVAAATNVASKVPILGAAAPLAVPAAASSGALALAQPVAQDGERAQNVKDAAVAGAVLGPAGAVVGKGVAKVAAPVLNFAANKLNVPPLWRPSFNASMAPAERDAVDTAMEQGVPVYGSQLRNPGSSLPPGRTRAQKDAFDRSIARSFGEDTDDLVKAFPQAQDRLSKSYDAILGNKTIPLDKTHLQDLKDITKYNNSRSPRFPPNADLDDMVQRASAAAKQTGSMSGKDFQNALQQYKALATQLSKSTEARPADYHAAQGVSKLINSLTQQAEKVLTPEEVAAFRETNRQWRNMSTLEGLAPRGADGTMNVKQLANVLARKRKNEFVYGQGDQTLPNLARYGNSFMGLEATAPKGLFAQGKNFARTAAPYLAGDVAGAYLMGNAMGGEHSSADSVAGELARYGALGLLTHGALSAGRNAMNPRLTRSDLYAPRGALGSALTSMQPGVAASSLLHAEKEE